MSYDTWKLASPEEYIGEDYESDRYAELKKMYSDMEDRIEELKAWYSRVSNVFRPTWKQEYEHTLDIRNRCLTRIGKAMECEIANY